MSGGRCGVQEVETSHHARVGDGGGDAVLEGDGARHPVAALADALQRDPPRVDLRPRQGVVHHGRDHLLPVGAEVEPLPPQGRSLARAVEGEAVVAARRAAGPAPGPHVEHRAVAAVVQDQQRPPLAGAVDPEEVARQRRPLVGDRRSAPPAGRRAAPRGPSSPAPAPRSA